MGRFHQDLRFGFRSLFRQPGFTLVSALTLALGIGANAAVVSFALPMLFPKFPFFEDPEQLVMLRKWRDDGRPQPLPTVSYPLFAEWQKHNKICSELALLVEDPRILSGTQGNPERVDGLLVSGDLVKALGIEPHLGRGFLPEDDVRGAEPTVMLSYELWQRHFGADPEILERRVTLDGLTYTVVGILPRGLAFEQLNGRFLGSVWLPINLFYDEWLLSNRTREVDFTPICRLKPGVTLEAASEDMARISRALAEEGFTSSKQLPRIEVMPIRDLETGSNRTMVLALLAGVVFVLFIACANLVNLFLSRFVGRQREFAIRLSLGASRRRLVALGLAEALALAVMATVLGLAAAGSVVRILSPLLADVRFADQARISPAVLGYTILLSLVATLAVGLIPSSRTVSPSWRNLLTSSMSSRSFQAHGALRKSLVVCEFALALLLLTGSGLALASFLNMNRENRGISPEQILALELDLPLPAYQEVPKWTRFFERILSGVTALPGVEGVALVSDAPGGDAKRGPLFASDREIPPRDERVLTRYLTVSPGFFQLLDIPLVEGRGFLPEDNIDSPLVLIISRSVAETFWPGESAVGRKFSFEGWKDIDNPEIQWREIVGVVEDIRWRSLQEPPHHTVFVPFTQRTHYSYTPSSNYTLGTPRPMTLLIKTRLEHSALADAVRSEVQKLDSGQPIDKVRMLEDFIADDLRPARTVLVLFSMVAALALALALAGIYGVMSYMAAAEKRSIGIRMALGAGLSQILGHMLRQALVSIVIGSVLGWGASVICARLAAHRLYGVPPFDPVVYIAATLVLGLIALLATAIPAVRATRIDPSLLLDAE